MFENITDILLMIFSCKTVRIPQHQNMLIHLDENMSILLVINMHNGNVRKF